MPDKPSLTAEESRGADQHYALSETDRLVEFAGSRNLVRNFLPPLFRQIGLASSARILDVGCGVGETVRALRDAGYDAYGLEPGGRYKDVAEGLRAFVFQAYSNDFAPADHFDFIMSHGVIEHVGTTDGHDTLGTTYMTERKAFASSLVRLLKPAGFILIGCPNRLFPFDFQHGPHSYGSLPAIKRRIPALHRLTLPWHERNYCCSFGEIAGLFEPDVVRPRRIQQRAYLNLGSLAERPTLRALFRLYIAAADRAPAPMWDFLHTHTLFLAQRTGQKDIAT